MNNSNYIKKYILLNIFTNRWKLGEKILTAKQLAIKFDVSLPTVKKEMEKFKKNNILKSKLRRGFFVNENLYKIVPLSIRKKYKLECESVNQKNNKNFTFLLKKYKSKNFNEKIWVECNVYPNVFQYSKYDKNKTFMHNLAINGIFINRIKSYFKIKSINKKDYLTEIRQLIDIDNNLVVKEIIYIPYEIWFEKKEIKF